MQKVTIEVFKLKTTKTHNVRISAPFQRGGFYLPLAKQILETNDLVKK